MIKKLLMFAITSGLASKLYKSYKAKNAGPVATNGKVTPTPTTHRAI